MLDRQTDREGKKKYIYIYIYILMIETRDREMVLKGESLHAGNTVDYIQDLGLRVTGSAAGSRKRCRDRIANRDVIGKDEGVGRMYESS